MGFLQSDNKSKAEILNEQFQSVFTKENLNNCPNKGNSPYQTMSDIKINCKGVTKLLKNQNIHKATGPDSIPSFILKSAADQLAPILTDIFQTSIDTGEVPQDWRDANIVPLFKKDERHLASNYRPVSLTSITCKILEHIVHSNIMDHFDKNKILTNAQHGFRKKRPCFGMDYFLYLGSYSGFLLGTLIGIVHSIFPLCSCYHFAGTPFCFSMGQLQSILDPCS
jgi:hypothetical protein